ncbi:MAG: sugar phosphate isomerase/epimerase, partial [Theionarchaea archaeon]|nr:sugar phosphate isomerase/epimerase [Theionarchaea archaeon]
MNIIASRPASYREHRHLAFEYLPMAGITNVEIPPPMPAEIDEMMAKLEKHGLTATSLMTRCNLGIDEEVDALLETIDTARKMDVGIIFCSTRSGDLPGKQPYEKLIELGDIAEKHQTVISMETHPDLCQNGDQMLATMAAVDHPNVRLNLDPANLHYYNKGLDAIEELERVKDYIASIHLKDTMGGFKEGHFPIIGRGIVDFPRMFEILNGLGFYGPFTLEIEGISGLNIEDTHQRVVDSVQYLMAIGVM